MIADLERSTFNNIEHQTLDFYKSSISPWLTNFEQRLNMQLTPGDRNLRFRFDVRELIRGDLKSEVESYGRLIELGVLNPNEVRERLDYNPREGGEEYIQGSNNLDFGNGEQGSEPARTVSSRATGLRSVTRTSTATWSSRAHLRNLWWARSPPCSSTTICTGLSVFGRRCTKTRRVYMYAAV